MSEKYKEIIKEVNASFAENNMEGFFKHCAENVEWKMVGDKTTKGVAAIREWMASMPNNEPPKINNQVVISEDDSAVSRGNMTMKNETGEDVSYDFCDVYKFENDKIIELTSFVIKTGE